MYPIYIPDAQIPDELVGVMLGCCMARRAVQWSLLTYNIPDAADASGHNPTSPQQPLVMQDYPLMLFCSSPTPPPLHPLLILSHPAPKHPKHLLSGPQVIMCATCTPKMPPVDQGLQPNYQVPLTAMSVTPPPNKVQKS